MQLSRVVIDLDIFNFWSDKIPLRALVEIFQSSHIAFVECTWNDDFTRQIW